VRLAWRARQVIWTRVFELILTAAAIATFGSKAFVGLKVLAEPGLAPALDVVVRQYSALFLVVSGVRLLVGDFPVRRVLHRLDLRPAQTVAAGFLATIVGGALLLSLPLVQWTADERVIGKSIGESDFPGRWQLELLAVEPVGTERLDIRPPSSYVLQEGDVLALLGTDGRLANFTK